MLVLTSKSFQRLDDNEKITKLITEVSNGKNVLMIANAATKETNNFIAREIVKECFENIGALKVDVVEIDSYNIASILDYDVVYVCGGDIRPLLYLVEKTNFKDYIVKFIKNGGAYIGNSSGSVIVGNDVKFIFDLKKGHSHSPEYVEIPQFTTGLGLFDINILPHANCFEIDFVKKCKDYERVYGTKLTYLNDDEYILINDDVLFS